MSDDKPRVGALYPMARLLEAMAGNSPVKAKKVRAWYDVVWGILSGEVSVGSRAPVKNTPPWVTLEVVKGGFTTGRFLAGGEVCQAERAKYAEIAAKSPGDFPAQPGPAAMRAALNSYFLEESGAQELSRLLTAKSYRLLVPEHGALLVACYLVEKGEVERAQDLIDKLVPFFSELAFYPVAGIYCDVSQGVVSHGDVSQGVVSHGVVSQAPGGDLFSVMTCFELSRKFDNMQETSDVKLMKQVLASLPLYDQMVALLLETVVGEAPQFVRDGNGLVRDQFKQPLVHGGEPLQKVDAGWFDRAAKILSLCKADLPKLKSCKYEKSIKHKLFLCFQDFVENRKAERIKPSWIKSLLAAYIYKNGLPGSEKLKSLRAMQQRQASQRPHFQYGKIVAARLRKFDPESGLSAENIEALLSDITDDELKHLLPSPGPDDKLAFPGYFAAKLRKGLAMPIAGLLEARLISSSEEFGRFLPELTGLTLVRNLSDERLANLYLALYSAFRQRRSLLLLNYESQVRFAELPWVSALSPFISDMAEEGSLRAAAKEALADALCLVLKYFPHSILPNKVVSELLTLTAAAGLKVPLIYELAVDIFMGDFSEKFLFAARDAAQLLEGSLYQSYYGIDYSEIRSIAAPGETEGVRLSKEFGRVCTRMAGLAETGGSGRRNCAENGRIIEQAQIVTTHNMASLVVALDLKSDARLHLENMVQSAFVSIVALLSMRVNDWRIELRRIKNAAYGFRQIVFYLSLLQSKGISIEPCLLFMEEHLAKLSERASQKDLDNRLAPILIGLRDISAGQSFDSSGGTAGGGRRFLGWSSGKHWLSTLSG
ncbi:MAG: hypothetical protein BWY75_00885 [bacterium ADurb.Bin425]|nr:MAG: hypothetical protein BWY75_00885 [bacterium ADurb.Bin425]